MPNRNSGGRRHVSVNQRGQGGGPAVRVVRSGVERKILQEVIHGRPGVCQRHVLIDRHRTSQQRALGPVVAVGGDQLVAGRRHKRLDADAAEHRRVPVGGFGQIPHQYARRSRGLPFARPIHHVPCYAVGQQVSHSGVVEFAYHVRAAVVLLGEDEAAVATVAAKIISAWPPVAIEQSLPRLVSLLVMRHDACANRRLSVRQSVGVRAVRLARPRVHHGRSLVE